MPQWAPGRHNWKPVSVQFNLPVKFKLEGGSPTSTSSNDDAPAKNQSLTIDQIQDALRARGYDPGVSDNIMGEGTKTAIDKFQKDNNLSGDGILNSETLKALGLNQAQKRLTGIRKLSI